MRKVEQNKLFKIRNKKTGEFYLVCHGYGYGQNVQASLKFTSFNKSKSYTRRGAAKGIINKFVKAGIASQGDLGTVLYDKPILELVEYDVIEVKRE